MLLWLSLTATLCPAATEPAYEGEPPAPAVETREAAVPPEQDSPTAATEKTGLGDEIAYPGQPPEPAMALEKRPTAVAELAKTKAGEPFSPLEAPAPKEGEEPAPIENPREWFELAGIDESHFRALVDGWPLSESEQEILLKVLYQVRRFDLVSMARWTRQEWSFAELAADPEQHRLEMFHITAARARRVIIEKPPAEVVRLYELPQYHLTEVEIGPEKLPALVVTPNVPPMWDINGPLDERISVQGLFLKSGVKIGPHSQLVFVSPRLAWHPDRVTEDAHGGGVNMGMTILGDYGMDVGQFARVANRKPITSADREGFYQMLWAADEMNSAELARYARMNLARLYEKWQQQTAQLRQEGKDLQRKLADEELAKQGRKRLQRQLDELPQRLAVLKKALAAAKENRYSVYPLFNLPSQQHGRLVMLEGEARRCIEVQVLGAGRRPEANRDIVQRFGIERYYEIEIFTKDSQNNPLVFCVRRLPEGFPTGDDIREEVVIPAFFFKTWAYHTQETLAAEDGKMRNRQQLAPLLIGPEPIWVQPEPAGQQMLMGIVAGSLFVAALLLIWIWVWHYRRSDREFHDKTLAARYTVTEGESLDELGLQAEDGPDFSHLK